MAAPLPRLRRAAPLALLALLALAPAADAASRSQQAFKSAHRKMGGHAAALAPAPGPATTLVDGYPGFPGTQTLPSPRPLEVQTWAFVAPHEAPSAQSSHKVVPTLYDEANGHYWEISKRPRDVDHGMGYGEGNVPGVLRETPPLW